MLGGGGGGAGWRVGKRNPPPPRAGVGTSSRPSCPPALPAWPPACTAACPHRFPHLPSPSPGQAFRLPAGAHDKMGFSSAVLGSWDGWVPTGVGVTPIPVLGEGIRPVPAKAASGWGLRLCWGVRGKAGGTVVLGGEGSVGPHWCHPGRIRGVTPGGSGTFALPDPRQNPDPMLWDGDGVGRHAPPEPALSEPCRVGGSPNPGSCRGGVRIRLMATPRSGRR